MRRKDSGLGKIRDVPRLARAIEALYPVSPDLQGPEHWRRVWASDLDPGPGRA